MVACDVADIQPVNNRYAGVVPIRLFPMASIDFDEVERFAQLFPTGECPKFPQAVADLPENLTQREMIRSAMPELWQRLHGGGEADLPADVMLRLHKGDLKAGDAEHLKAAGLEAAALELNRRLQEEQLAAMQARMEAEMEAREAAKEQQHAAIEMARMESVALTQRHLAAQNRSF